MMIGSGLQALTTLGKFKPMVLGEIQAAGDERSLTEQRADEGFPPRAHHRTERK
jgi:hypothetical protein